MDIAEKIRNARVQQKYTQEQAAERLLVSRQTISNWENGKSLPDILSIIKMSELYGLSLDELVKGDQAVLKKVERDVRTVKTQRRVIHFAWLAIALGTALLILGDLWDGNPVIDFLNGALPWVFLGVMTLSAILYLQPDEKQ